MMIFGKVNSLLILTLVLFGTIDSSSALAVQNNQTPQKHTSSERAAQLEAKLQDVRKQFETLRTPRKDNSEQATQLRSKRDEIDKKMVTAYQTAAKALSQNINAAKAELAAADKSTRSDLVKLIEKNERELEKIKNRLESSKK